MDCPKCKQEMSKGVIWSNREIYWSEKKPSAVLPKVIKIRESERISSPLWGDSKADALRCGSCGIVIIVCND